MADGPIDSAINSNMGVGKISPYDVRLQHRYQEINGRRWHYVDIIPQRAARGTVFLIHGFPDIWLAWRYQIPMLLDLGLRCIMLSCMGYADTGPSPNLADYGFRSHADAIAGIAKANGIEQIILGGHDWGGALVYRVGQYYPDLVKYIFAVATPYPGGITKNYISTEKMVEGGAKTLRYQLLLGSEDHKVEKVVNNERNIRRFLMGTYGGRVNSPRPFWTAEDGPDLDYVASDQKIGMTPLLDHSELNYYVATFARSGGIPCDWYRTRKVNWELDQVLYPDQGVYQPTLFIQCLKDNVLVPSLAKGIEGKVHNLTRGEVNAAHWALWQKPHETNDIIRRWLDQVVFAGKSKI